MPKTSDGAPPKQAKRKRVVRRAPVEAEKTDELPVDYMLRVMRDPKAPQSRRDTMAKSATPYLHSKSSTKSAAQDLDAAIRQRLETARETLARKIAQLRSDAD